MILYEHEGKKIFQDAGISIPNGQIVTTTADSLSIPFPVVLKAQVLSGKRADAGGILFAKDKAEYDAGIVTLLQATINKEKVEQVLVEEMVDIKKEYYVSLTYDTSFRQPILTFSESGGTGIENRKSEVFPINPLDPLAGLTTPFEESFLKQLIAAFFEADALLMEINPLVVTSKGEWVALDAKVKLDDFAKPRHKEWDYSPRSAPGHNPTKGEIEAKKIDEGDYRGTAGSSYFDIEGGDIAVLSSGGGVSLTALDSLINYGGKPANFTEYSGNPPKEKVAKLTKVVLDKPNINGLWVIGTVVANFTDIYVTLSGFIEGLKETEKLLGAKFDFPIVIRRGGPRVEEAYEMLRGVKDFDLHLQGEETSIAQSAKIMAELAREYAEKKGENQS